MTNVVRAKFVVSAAFPADSGVNVHLSAVIKGDENAAWAKATPAGHIQMLIGNPAAAEMFVPGRELYVDFSEA